MPKPFVNDDGPLAMPTEPGAGDPVIAPKPVFWLSEGVPIIFGAGDEPRSVPGVAPCWLPECSIRESVPALVRTAAGDRLRALFVK